MESPKLLQRPTIVLTAAFVVACGAPATSPSPSTSPVVSPSQTVVGSPSLSALPAVRVERAAPMLRARTGFDSVLLGDGSVLAVGDDVACLPGPAEPGSETAERYDPASDTWTAAQSLNKPRKSFATVALRDGRAMVLAGIDPDNQPFSSTKIFDPETGTWSDGPILAQAIGEPLAAVLGDGWTMSLRPRAFGETGYASAVELLDPARGAWASGEEVEMYVTAVVTLQDGSVLARGGAFESPELLYHFDPAEGRWSPVPAPIEVDSPDTYGSFGRLVPLGDGSVLALSVSVSGADPFPSVGVARLDPASGRWSMTTPMSTAREGAATTVLADGRVLVAGGVAYDASGESHGVVATTEIYDPAADAWTAGPELLEPRKDGAGLLLRDGSVLILGGDVSFNTQGDVPWCPDPMTSTERVYLGS